MKPLLIILLFLSAISLHAQTHDISQVHSGYLITHTDSINGTISLDLKSNTILFRTSNSMQNYSAKQFIKVVYFDDKGIFRTFVSGYWGADHQSTLFEELVGGSKPLLYREGLKFNQFDVEEYSPYFTKKAESIYSLGNKRDILNLFQNQNEISAFVRKNKLKVKVKEDLIVLFSHVNDINPVTNSSVAVDEI